MKLFAFKDFSYKNKLKGLLFSFDPTVITTKILIQANFNLVNSKMK